MNGTQKQETVTEITTFINDLIDKRLSGQALATEERENLQKTLLDQLGVFLLESIYEELTDDQQKAFKQLIDEKKSFEELRSYASEQIDTYDEFVLDVMLDFEDAYLAGELDASDATTQFINSLIERKNFENLTPELYNEIFSDVAQRLDEFIMARSLAQFSQDEVAQFKQMLEEKKDRATLQQYAMDHIADYPKFLDETLDKFEEAYLA